MSQSSQVRTGRGSVLGWYAATVFLSSAFVMVLEIVAGRVIAPYVGVSLYTWTSVIGVVLAGLSLGNWLGGVWADRGGGPAAAGVALGTAGISAFISLPVLGVLAPAIHQAGFGILSASFLFVLATFFMPAMLLGIVTPLLTTLALALDTRSGHVVGRMHALGALGSILGTFAAGYLLLQYFGSRAIVAACGAALLLLALPYLLSARRALAVTVLAGGVLAWGTGHLRADYVSPCERESVYFCMRDVDQSMEVPFGDARGLVLDYLLHGINHRTRPDVLVAPYVHLMDELVHERFTDRAEGLRYFFAGGGSYTHPRAVRAVTPGAAVTVAEIDPAVTDFARRRLFADTDGMTVYHADARVVLASAAPGSYDVVITDVFHDISIPYHLVTREFAQLVAERLAPGGLYAVNIVDAYPDPRLVKALVRTLRPVFRHVDIWLEEDAAETERMTYVVSASDTWSPPSAIEARRGFPRRWTNATADLTGRGTPVAALPVLRDDFVPVERLMSGLLISSAGR